MSKIRILPEQLANQIAAGEVIERPASVVKELVENSLDANATRIEVEIEGGGTRLIRIIDNGEGMDEDDILLCLERHGTSKIQSDEDLHAISTLGFRGEAIPSIASVSHMSITSRSHETELGTQATIKFGKLLKVHETGSPKGTQIEIKNLFGNTPARKKFLRTNRTELGHIEEIIKNYTLAAPKVTFTLRINGKEVLHLDGSQSLMQRVQSIIHFNEDLIEIKSNKRNRVMVHGFLVPPDKPVAASSKMRLFVNNRAVKDRMLGHAVMEGLRSFLMKGRQPLGILHITLPPDEIDVNVHPAKHEIRFINARDVHRLVVSSIQEAMQEEQLRVKAALFGNPENRNEQVPIPQQDLHNDSHFFEQEPVSTHLNTKSKETETVYQHPSSPAGSPRGAVSNVTDSSVFSPDQTDYIQQTAAEAGRTEASQQALHPSTQNETQSKTALQAEEIPSQHHSFQIIGQFHNLYIFCQNEQGLFVIDQHAAHERLLFEDLKKQFYTGRLTSQNLLFPETVELSVFQAQLVEKNREQLEQMGFSIRDFGGNTFILSAIPALAGQAGPSRLFLDILDQFGNESGKSRGASRLDDILADLACKAAVKAGHELSEVEIDTLLNRMIQADLFSHCPHGRPVFKILSQDDVKKWFHRT